MGNNPRKLSDLARARIEKLREDGVNLTDENIVAINALAWEVVSPSKCISLSKGRPVRCGNVWFWPLTIHSASWFQEIGCELEYKLIESIFHNVKLNEYALAYAMAHRDDDLYMVSESQIRTWSKTLRATPSELRECLKMVIDSEVQDEYPTTKDDKITIQELACYMHAKSGGSAKMWEHELSVGYVFNLVNTMARQSEAGDERLTRNRAEACLAYYCHKLRKAAKNG